MPKTVVKRKHCPYCSELYFVRSGGYTRHVLRCPHRPEDEGGAPANGSVGFVVSNAEGDLITYTSEGDLRLVITVPRSVVLEAILRSLES